MVRLGLESYRVVVTGAGRGLGRSVAVGFAAAGAEVWIGSRTASELEVTASQIRDGGGRVHSVQVDLADPDACDAFATQVLERSGGVHILVNNAAILQFATVAKLQRSIWLDTLAINLTAPFVLVQAFLPAMRREGGSIINVSSQAGVKGFANEAAYCASKFGLEGFTRSLGLELQGTPISVNTLTPGLRIKPTSVTDDDVFRRSPEERRGWEDPQCLMPAFLCLSRLRGEVNGLRFDAFRLSQTLAREGGLTPARLQELAE